MCTCVCARTGAHEHSQVGLGPLVLLQQEALASGPMDAPPGLNFTDSQGLLFCTPETAVTGAK